MSLPCLSVEDLVEVAAGKTAVILDTRGYFSFAAGYVPGTIGIGLDENFGRYASMVVPKNMPIYLIAITEQVSVAVAALAAADRNDVVGYFLPTAVEDWEDEADAPLASIRQLAPKQVAAGIAKAQYQLLDVRQQEEWEASHVGEAIHIPLAQLSSRVHDVPVEKPVLLLCRSGGRSLIGATLLKNAGFPGSIINLKGGVDELINTLNNDFYDITV